ncbi:MAG TPA: GIDE domain-containing protein, partial [Synergistaceae bacterium]|nr:GIDE domain-containing protein [Synergistaceae bacterium]
VVGEVRDSSGSLRIGKPTGKDKPFVVSVKSGESVVQDRESSAKTTFYLGIALMAVGVAVAIFIK